MALQDPVQEELWNTNHFCLIVRECFRSLENNKPLQGLDYEDCPKAIRVPVSESGILEAKAFHSTTRVRHACLDVGFSAISPQAWRYCHALRIVKLPDTVVTLGYAAFQGRYSLQVAEMPGCVEFGVRVFSECCALESVGNIVDGGSHLAIGAIISQYAFEDCAKLAHLSLPHVRAVVDSSTLTSPQAGLPQGCFFASGIQQVELGEDTHHIGHRAFENCKTLTRVKLANTGIRTLHMHTFAQCHSLETIRLPNCAGNWSRSVCGLQGLGEADSSGQHSLSIRSLWLKFSVQTHQIDGQEVQGFLLKRRDFLSSLVRTPLS